MTNDAPHKPMYLEWHALGKQLVALAKESYRGISSGGIKCRHCGVCSPGDKDTDPFLVVHDEYCEVGKAQELLAGIRRRLKGSS